MNLKTKHCAICREKEKLKELYPRNFNASDLKPELFSARRVTEHFHYQIVRCLNCGLVFSREILPEDVLEKLYSESKVNFEEYAEIIAKDYWYFLKPHISLIKREKALEIGCSSGFFMQKLADYGFDAVYGCEPSQEAAEKASAAIRPNITIGFFKPAIYPEKSFDLVCSFQTLDHLSDPVAVLRGCFQLLKPGGLAYFVVHDANSYQAGLLKDKSPIIDIEHIYLFNKNTLAKIFQLAGFEVIRVANLKNSYPLKYWTKMLSFNIIGCWIDKLVNYFKLGNVSFPLAAGNIYVLAKIER